MSSLSFGIGGIVPPLAVIFAPAGHAISIISAVSLVFFAALGALAARAGGAPILRGTTRTLIWGAVAMNVTGAFGVLFGVFV